MKGVQVYYPVSIVEAGRPATRMERLIQTLWLIFCIGVWSILFLLLVVLYAFCSAMAQFYS